MNLRPKLERSGFAVVTNAISSSTCAECLAVLEESNNAGSRTLLENDVVRGVVAELRRNLDLTSTLATLVAIQCTSFVKTVGRNWAVRLHRDRVVPVKGIGPWKSVGEKEGLMCARPPIDLMRQMVAVRLSLDGAPEGDLQVLPGSHIDVATMGARSEAVSVKVDRGGALVMKPLLAHASTKLQESPARRVLHYLFAPAELPAGYEWYDAV